VVEVGDYVYTVILDRKTGKALRTGWMRAVLRVGARTFSTENATYLLDGCRSPLRVYGQGATVHVARRVPNHEVAAAILEREAAL
jgi:hypothetical protein